MVSWKQNVHQYREDERGTWKTLQHKLTEETASLHSLRHDATNIDQLSHHKLLGLIIDKDFSFEARIDE